ncbi:nucleoside 2-deoxyribosyltransferase domain-containing protein [Adhaeretor mobilis]|uniref:Nucleoside 2-deoxyribosyltransferase like n=1 Tax=Adhaeretor mobilis TaxID=1930276 RepID=A0A517MWG3_9BACT|nr:nucleoside 2-deoxyribosyltransferase domain-containing protein [Adhaeretor mobilis]QDS99220.1 hypothetical protein HG15A2_25120 [Adhaeretor mobilis]
MNYLEAPTEYDADGRAVFLAGGITDAENWQSDLIESLQGVDATVLNPRRKEFPMNDESAGLQQIEWEHRHLAKADLIAFWFPPQTLCPIALFELGACCASSVPLVVGTSPEYARRFDVVTQLRLLRPEVNVHDSLEELQLAIMEHPLFEESLR